MPPLADRIGLRRLSARIHDAGAVHAGARLGYLARGAFYGMLAYLVVRVAMLSGTMATRARQSADAGNASRGSGEQANAQGALSLISESLVGKAALLLTAVGFLLLSGVRLRGAWREREAGRLRRATVAGQGLLYLLIAYLPISFLLGDHATGSEQEQHQSARQLLELPGGPLIVVVLGIAVLAVCAWQVRGVLRQDFTDGMQLRNAPGWIAAIVRLTGTVGIAGRAVLFVPLALFLIVSGTTFDARRARGLDAELLLLAGNGWGKSALAVIAFVLLTFACYSVLEARYRDLTRGV